MKGFLICPVRGVDPKETEGHIRELESQGIDMHWPPRDTNQDDPIGFKICTQNMNAIKDADVVYVVWDEKSQGCLFDLGMAFSMGKKIEIIDIPAKTSQKSFQNMMRHWEERCNESN
jgi:nucleoside 2-deoxyribosyltransferase